MIAVMYIPPHKEKPLVVIHYFGRWVRGWRFRSQRKDNKNISIDIDAQSSGFAKLSINNRVETNHGRMTITLGRAYPEVWHYFIEEI